jgi:hypothetical protein
MYRLISLFLVLLFIGCTTSRVVKKTEKTTIREIVVESDSAKVSPEIDLLDPEVPGAYTWETYDVDTAMIDVRIPKKIDFKSTPQTLKLDDRVSVDVIFEGSIDSGKVQPTFSVSRVTYQESTVVKQTKETKTRGSIWSPIKIFLYMLGAILLLALIKFLRK